MLPTATTNQHSAVAITSDQASGLFLLSRGGAQTLKLRVDGASGPDGLAARVLKTCAAELALLFTKLWRIIVRTSIWPT